MARIRKGDQVKVVAGRDKGAEGKVIGILENDRVIVEGVNRVQRHTKATQGVDGGIITAEAPVHASNVMLVVDADGGKTTTRVGSKSEDGRKIRISRKTGKEI